MSCGHAGLSGEGLLPTSEEIAKGEVSMSMVQSRSRALPPPLRPHPAYEAFHARREFLVASGKASPVVRIASFLLYLVRTNMDYGFAPMVIADDLRSGVVADHLGCTVDDLSAHLAFMRALGLIAPAPSGGLIVTDVEGLERLADGP